jgi:glycerol-3-phosphate dehydrogenase
VSILGTTDVTVDTDQYEITREEVRSIVGEAAAMMPAVVERRVLRVFAGARPLYDPAHEAGARFLSRGHTVLDHAGDGVENFVSIVGGKLTTYRLMAEEGIDAMCRSLGVDRPCRTADEPLPGSENGTHYAIAQRLAEIERRHGDENALVCECEYVLRSRIEQVARERATHDLDDIRRELRLGMGPCQGGFCTYRAAGVLHDLRHLSPDQTNAALLRFLEARWKGVRPVLWGDDLRQIRLDEEIYLNLLGVDRLPIAPAESSS